MKHMIRSVRAYVRAAILILSLLLVCGCRREETFYPQDVDSSVITEETFYPQDAAPSVITEESETGQIEGEPTAENSGLSDEIFVHVAGAVQSPGVVTLRAGARVIDAVDAAGGLREDADGEYCNLAAAVRDGEQIRILTKEEAAKAREKAALRDEDAASGMNSEALSSAFPESVQADSRVNINTASKEELMAIPGIGASRAEDIIKYREKAGAFSKIEDIMQVPGIKEGVFRTLRDLIRV